jgi:hypothetical protein
MLSDKPTRDVALLVYRQPHATAPFPFTGLFPATATEDA